MVQHWWPRRRHFQLQVARGLEVASTPVAVVRTVRKHMDCRNIRMVQLLDTAVVGALPMMTARQLELEREEVASDLDPQQRSSIHYLEPADAHIGLQMGLRLRHQHCQRWRRKLVCRRRLNEFLLLDPPLKI